MAMELRTGGVMVLPVRSNATAAQLDAFKASAVAAFLDEWERQRKALEDRLVGSCTRCGESLDAGLIYLQGRRPVCVSCYRLHTATGDGAQGENP